MKKYGYVSTENYDPLDIVKTFPLTYWKKRRPGTRDSHNPGFPDWQMIV
jgi:hypothetical protein